MTGPCRRGIGTALVRAGEATAHKLGHRRVALGVGWTTPTPAGCTSASATPTGATGSFVATYQDRDRDGPPVTITETIDMPVKNL